MGVALVIKHVVSYKIKISMVSRDRRDPIVLQKVRKQGIKLFHDCPKSKETKNKVLAQVNTKKFWQEIIYKSLIPTFGKHTVMTNKPKVGIKLL